MECWAGSIQFLRTIEFGKQLPLSFCLFVSHLILCFPILFSSALSVSSSSCQYSLSLSHPILCFPILFSSVLSVSSSSCQYSLSLSHPILCFPFFFSSALSVSSSFCKYYLSVYLFNIISQLNNAEIALSAAPCLSVRKELKIHLTDCSFYVTIWALFGSV